MPDLNAALDELTSPIISITQGISGNWHPTTPRDRQILTGMGIEIPYAGVRDGAVDGILGIASQFDYWLETIPAQES